MCVVPPVLYALRCIQVIDMETNTYRNKKRLEFCSVTEEPASSNNEDEHANDNH